MEQPKVESKYLNGVHVEHNINAVEGLCEICGSCFKRMVEQFINVVK